MKKHLIKALIILTLFCTLTATLSFGASAAVRTDARNLLDGVDFDDYTSTSGNESYIRKKTGMFFSSQIEDTFRSGIKIVEESKGDYALSVQTAPVFVNGTVRDENKKDNFNDVKYAKSGDILDLFYTKDGPEKFTFSFDMTIKNLDDTSYKFNVAATTDGGTNERYSPYRGCSMFSFIGHSYCMKVTGANLPLLEDTVIDGVTYKKGTVPDVRKNMGYFYAVGKALSSSNASDNIAFTDSKCTTPTTTVEGVTIGDCITPAQMGQSAFTYTVGEPIKVRFECTRTDSKLSVAVYIGNKLFYTRSITSDKINTDEGKMFGWRINDNLMHYTLDNIDLDIKECGGNHTGAWADVNTTITEHKDANGNLLGQYITRECNLCKKTETVYSNVIYQGKDAGATTGPILFTMGNDVDFYNDILCGKDIWISFEIGVQELPTDTTGKSLFTIMHADYAKLLRLFGEGELRLHSSSLSSENIFNAQDSDLRLEVGKSYKIDIYIDGATERYDVFIDGKFFGSDTSDFDRGSGETYKLRVSDTDTGKYAVSDMAVYTMVAPSNHNHTFDCEVTDSKYLITPAVCNARGVYYKSCICGVAGSETFNSKEFGDHSYTIEEATDSALVSKENCIAPAVYKKACEYCGGFGSETFNGTVLGDHSFTLENPVASALKTSATCKKPAVYYKTCVYCGENGKETFEYGEPVDHSFTAEVTTYTHMKKRATCTSAAVYCKSCEYCGISGDETFVYGEPTAHEYVNEVVDSKYLASAAGAGAYAVYYKSCVCGGYSDETFDTTPVLWTEYAEGIAGETVSVKLNVKYNPGIVAAYVKVNFDETKLQLVSAENGVIFEDKVFGDEFKDGYILTWDESLKENNTFDGTLAVLNFKILEGTEKGKTEISVSVTDAGIINYDLEKINVKCEKSIIKVVSSVETDLYVPQVAAVNGNITVFEFKAAYLPTDIGVTKYYPLLTLKREGATLDLLYFEASSGEVAIRTADGDYETLMLDSGKVTLSGESTQMAVIYDDANALVRYYVGTHLPYYHNGEGVALSNDVAVYGNSFANYVGNAEISFISTTAEELDVSVKGINVYNINESGTSEIVAFQENDITKGIRLLSGVDMPWYALIGYDVETFIDGVSQGEYELSSHKIYSSIIANDRTVLPTDYGFRYFSALAIEEVNVKSDKSYYMILKPFTRVGKSKYYGSAVKIIVSEDGSYFDESYGTPIRKNSILALDFNTSLSVPEYINSVEGIAVDASLNGGTISDGKWSYSSNALAFEDRLGIFELDKYGIEFDFCFDSFVNKETSIFTIITDGDGKLDDNSDFTIPFRMDTSGKVFNNSSKALTYQLETGKRYKFEAVVDNIDKTITIYVNGNKISETAHGITPNVYNCFRFMDGSRNCSMWIDNFTIYGIEGERVSNTLNAAEGTYVRGGSYADTVMDISDGNLQVKISSLTNNNTDTTRKALIRFDISGLDANTVKYAPFALSMPNVSDERSFRLSLIPSTWSSDSVTFNSMPQATKIIGENIKPFSNVVDMSSHITDALSRGETSISILVEAENVTEGQTMITFSDSVRPHISIYNEVPENGYLTKLSNDEAVNESVWEWAQKMYDEWYARYQALPEVNTDAELIVSDSTQYTKKNYASSHSTTYDSKKVEYSSRPLSAITDLDSKVSDEFKNADFDIYGGIMIESLKQNATGYFYTEKIDGRWWIIDPLGYPYISVGLSDIHYSQLGSKLQKNNVLKEYGSFENWAVATTARVRDGLSFNSTARPVAEIRNLENGLPFIYAPTSVMSSYGAMNGIRNTGSGSTLFTENNTMPVFDPKFAEYAELWAEKYITYNGEKRLIGYTSDNELPMNLDMLKRSLAVVPDKEVNYYTYACAWTWLKNMTGKEKVSFDDVTDELSQLYLGFVWDRYYYVVANAVKNVDPDHMYMGTRFLTKVNETEWVYRFSAQYLDCMTINWYFEWEPGSESLYNIERFGDMPFVVTEFYTKAGDSGLGNTSGAGRYVATQEDRADFYDTFVLKLLESRNCVGWEWFQYMDNDPNSGTSDSSSIDSNKGIVASDLTEYTVLTERMKSLNEKAYMLADYFGK